MFWGLLIWVNILNVITANIFTIAKELICLAVRTAKNGAKVRKKKMTNREWIDRKSNATLGDMFCMEIAKDGGYCKDRCPFSKLCVGGVSGFEVWLNQERRKEDE